MTGTDNKLSRCLSMVAEKSGLGDWTSWTKRDFEQLSMLIEQKTRISLSVSTLIRLYKGTSGRNPQKVTLDALAQFVGFDHWHAYSTCADITQLVGFTDQSESVPKKKIPVARYIAGSAILILVLGLGIRALVSNWPINPKDVKFRVINREITGIPATIQVEYDLGKHRPDKLWLQLYWNPEESVMLNPDQNRTSAIYCYPGVHACKLIADKRVVGEQKVYIKTSGWAALLRHNGRQLVPLYIRNKEIINNGVLQVTESMINTHNLAPNSEILTSYYYVNDLGSIYSNDYTISGRISNPPVTLGTQPCSFCTVFIIGENGKHFFSIGDLGCSAYFRLSFSGADVMSTAPDQTAFEYVSGGWIPFTSIVSGNNVVIYSGRTKIYSYDQVADIGKIKGIHFNFSGLGAIDQVKLVNSTGYVAMDEDFE
jgi:hypothetical protein